MNAGPPYWKKALPPVAVLLAALALPVGLGWWLASSAADTLARRQVAVPSAVSELEKNSLGGEEYTQLLQQYNQESLADSKEKRPIAAQRDVPPIDESLLENSTFGSLPVIGSKGKTPLQEYRAKLPLKTDKTLTVIVVADSSNKTLLSDTAAQLPAPVSIALSPYADGLDEVIDDLRGYGHEALMLVPMEAPGYPYTDPGRRALMQDNDDSQNRDRLLWMLGRGIGYVGIMPLFGSGFTEAPWRIEPVLKEAAQRGLMFADATTKKGKEVTASRAAVHQLAHVAATSSAASAQDRETLRKKTLAAVASARKQPGTVLVLPMLPVVPDILISALPADISLLPVSALALDRLEQYSN